MSALNQEDLADKPATIPTLMFKLLMAVAFAVALLAMVQGHQHQYKPLPTRPMPAVLIP